MELFEQLIIDAIFSAIAAIGFAVISNPPAKAVMISAILSAIGHSFRYFLLFDLQMNIAVATFFAAFLIGLMSVLFAKIIRCPSEVFTFPSLLPMIPGMYAYRMFLSFAKFTRTADSALYSGLIEDIFANGMTALFVMLALVVGVSIPVMLFHRESFRVTRR
ncbi:MAG: threonine/serine exporter family protein [Rikenellaceae bacterium]